ncbi:putative indole-3-pyruvate monooxygenase YUCCA11 [Senna tora]|uniref:Flavin-containing monooxygenase n=1 Tax=Senna tora TaxID=362788 RepID=A0A834TG14_9FABA|nr:putative indole-3-pyruvate monooxygenase YUCCA11 [Senna tora]
MAREVSVVIVGGGPSGLATSACLNRLSIPNIVLEKDECLAPLWRKRTYDRLKLHLAKRFCNLPHMPFPSDAPTFVPRVQFMRYLDDYVSRFKISIRYNRTVETAAMLEGTGKWKVVVKDTSSDAYEVYVSEFVVVASGENSEGCIPELNGLEEYEGEYMHCNRYVNGREWYNKNVLVVGAGNSGMEIAFDLFNWGANTSIVVRSPVHVLTKEMVMVGMHLGKYVGVEMVDRLMIVLSKLKYGDMSKYGLRRPKEGPFFVKAARGRAPTIDVGCVHQIKAGKVFPAISSIKTNKVIEFEDGRQDQFDVIIFATGYRSTALNWLKDYKELFNEDGKPKRKYPNHWKGENGIYCAGFSSRGLEGISYDAQKIADDIAMALAPNNFTAAIGTYPLLND